MRSYPKTTEPLMPGINTTRQDNAPGFTIHPPGVATSPNEFNYEPQSDNSWKMYPPGVSAPPDQFQASMPQAATPSDLMRMQHEMSQIMGVSRTGV
jgi:hypothetical protein